MVGAEAADVVRGDVHGVRPIPEVLRRYTELRHLAVMRYLPVELLQ